MPVADQAIPSLLEELARRSAPRRSRTRSSEPGVGDLLRERNGPSDLGVDARDGLQSHAIERMPPPRPPRMSLLTLIGIFSLVFAVVVIVGRVVIRHRTSGAPSGAQSSSARSVSTSR